MLKLLWKKKQGNQSLSTTTLGDSFFSFFCDYKISNAQIRGPTKANKDFGPKYDMPFSDNLNIYA